MKYKAWCYDCTEGYETNNKKKQLKWLEEHTILSHEAWAK